MNHPNRNKIRDWPAYLQAFRAEHNISQAKLADCLKMSKRCVEDWEQGRREPQPYLKIALQKIAQDFS